MKKVRIKWCMGTVLAWCISIITLGMGKYIATRIANRLGYEDCGCNSRETRINEFFGCYKDVKL